MVPIGEHAGFRGRSQIAPQPGLFSGARRATADDNAVRVDRDQVPAADVEAVVPAARNSAVVVQRRRCGAEVRVVARSAQRSVVTSAARVVLRVVLVIARYGTDL